MNWVHEFQGDSLTDFGDPALPRKLVRHLLFAHGVGPASRLLVTGCERGDVLGYFSRLGLAVTAIHHSPDVIEAARDVAPTVEFECGSTSQLQHRASHAFDLAVAWATQAEFDGSLFSPAAFHATADLLTCLRPGGHLVLLAHYDRPGDAPQHEPSCYRRHLTFFPGTVDDAEFSDSARPAENLRRMIGRPPLPAYVAATISLSNDLLGHNAWHHIAETAARSCHQTCCARSQEMSTERRSAA